MSWRSLSALQRHAPILIVATVQLNTVLICEHIQLNPAPVAVKSSDRILVPVIHAERITLREKAHIISETLCTATSVQSRIIEGEADLFRTSPEIERASSPIGVDQSCWNLGRCHIEL